MPPTEQIMYKTAGSHTKQCHQAVPPISATNEASAANAAKEEAAMRKLACLAAGKDAAAGSYA